jgi:putative Holliday junction resolvase
LNPLQRGFFFAINLSFVLTLSKKMPRILAIDYGFKRTGIAITDELQIIASGLTTIPSETAIAFLKDYFSKEKR